MKKEGLFVVYRDGKPYSSPYQKIKGAYFTPGYAKSIIRNEAEFIAAEEHGGGKRIEYWKLDRATRARLEAAILPEFEIVRYVPETQAADKGAK